MNTLWSSLLLSFRIASAATFLTALLGIPLAFAMARLRFPGKSILEALIILPLVLPPTVVGYLILIFLGGNSPIGSWLKQAFNFSIIFSFPGAVLASFIVALPLLYLPAKASFQNVDRELEDVSRLLGATRLQMFWHVSLPLARQGILSGLLLAFARALGEFGATIMVFGWQPHHLTLPISIYSDFFSDDLASATPAVLTLMLISFVVILVYNRSTRSAK